MKNPFKAFQEYVRKTPRNSFDLSHLNNLTLPYGLIVPDLVLDVTAGDSFQIDAAFAFNFLPMNFPIQTPVRINQYFFYVRYRNTMDSYKDMRYGNKSDIVHPYIKQDASFFKTCSLADYMGIPTTLSVGETGYLAYPLNGSLGIDSLTERSSLHNLGFDSASLVESGTNTAIRGYSSTAQTLGTSGQIGATSVTRSQIFWFWSYGASQHNLEGKSLMVFLADSLDQATYLLWSNLVSMAVVIDGIDLPINVVNSHAYLTVQVYLNNTAAAALTAVHIVAYNPRTSEYVTDVLNTDSYDYVAADHTLTIDVVSASSKLNRLLEEMENYNLVVIFEGLDRSKYSRNDCFALGRVAFPITATRPIDISDHPELNPFCSVNGEDPVLRLNALPFRAYEQVYNAYFRNERVEPFMKNGEVEYNDYGTTYADGADTTPYELKHRNWELDMLTSCLKSPQQGTAPIVGVDSRRITFSDGDRDYNFLYQTNPDGTLSAEGARFEEEDVPGSIRNSAVDLVTAGFTIEQLREGNAATLWVEKNIRRGLRYRDQLKAHTGIDLDYDELELPEFLGGFSHYMDVQQVTASADTAGAVLGDIAGKGSAFKKATHKISHFYREDGVVLGLICIVPQPVYSQNLSKFWLRTGALDYYNSEFSHLGMQPVPYSEVAPIQMYQEMQQGGERTMETPFGYNRPNYDMVSMSDEVHGLFRTTDRDFLLMRTFDGVPELGADFIHVDGSQLNNVFSVVDDNGQIARGQVAFKIYGKRPVPAVGEPRLE